MSAEEVYNRAFLRYMTLTTPLFSFHVVLDKALPLVEPEFRRIGLELSRELVAKKLIINPNRYFLEGMDKVVAAQYVDSTLKGARSVARASAIVFSHAILDAIAFDACQVTLIVAPDEWATDLMSRKVSLETVRTSDYGQIRDAKLSEYFEQLERESLLKKCDLLHARCRPEPSWDLIENYKYDRETLEEFDELRHEIIHGDKLSGELDDVEDTLMYVSKTCLYLLLLVSKRFGVKIDPYFGIREQLKSGEAQTDLGPQGAGA